MDTLTLFSKNLNQRSLTPRWPLTPCLLRSHVWLYPRIIVSKSHGNTSMYVDAVINFANYHIHTYTYIHTTYILRTEWVILNSVQARQKLMLLIINSWTRTHRHAALGAISWPWHWCTQRAELQLWLVHKRFSWAYLWACVRSRRDWLHIKQYQRIRKFIRPIINNNLLNSTSFQEWI